MLIFANMSLPKISIITPSYNQGQFIEQTIDSVLSQGYPNVEYIIIDGGSTDNSVEIIKKYAKHISYWISEKDNGQSDAINKGLKIASGDVINWLNSDDYYEPNALLTIGQYFEDDSIHVLAGKSKIWKNDSYFISPGTDIYPTVEKTIGYARIDQPETFFRKSVIDKIEFLNTNLHYVMDKEWWIRYLMQYGLKNVKKTDDVLVNFRIHESSKTNSQKVQFIQETFDLYYTLAYMNNLEEASLMNKNFRVNYIDGLSDIHQQHTSTMQCALHYFLLLHFRTMYAQNNYQEAKKTGLLLNEKYLQEADLHELYKLKKRIKYLPLFLKKLWNKNA